MVSFSDGFHGRSFGALSATWREKYQAPFAPLIPGFVKATYNDMDSINELVNENTCGVIIEPIQGEGGIMQAKEEWLRALRKRCNEVDALLIYDEIQVSSRLIPFLYLISPQVRPISDRKALGTFIFPQRLSP